MFNSYQEAVDAFNEKFKSVRTWEAFKEIEKEMYDSGWAPGFCTKRSNKGAYHFDLQRNGIVVYLLDDGYSIGRCKVENLYKYLKIK